MATTRGALSNFAAHLARPRSFGARFSSLALGAQSQTERPPRREPSGWDPVSTPPVHQLCVHASAHAKPPNDDAPHRSTSQPFSSPILLSRRASLRVCRDPDRERDARSRPSRPSASKGGPRGARARGPSSRRHPRRGAPCPCRCARSHRRRPRRRRGRRRRRRRSHRPRSPRGGRRRCCRAPTARRHG